ncbi:tRNA splicing endonuclease subunit sen2 [Maudiozyma exigua]|uniref:tRNA-splicing endonuclease subunit Sen2 n=1 Tax=Maudiozyma exigua TaxID=34358 RepID=A0A9P6W183_MAUEX|nr:tRNA splicing endonuclease subunit sen2 [Kazachstania exigua]
MSKRVSNTVRYKYPLPIHPLDLPQLFVHNPISWAYWLYSYITSYNALSNKIHVDITKHNNFIHIEVRDLADMKYLWDRGFFGTGQLSRSEPTWYEQTRKKFQSSSDGKSNGMSLERVTKLRRKQRVEFKKQREIVEEKLLQLRREGNLTPEQEVEILEQERDKLRKFKDDQASLHIMDQDEDITEQENKRLLLQRSEILDENDNLLNLESLQLMPVETIFLSFALPILDISPVDFISKCCLTDISRYSEDLHTLLIQYAAYHHYRSHGWCVRSGIKFGSDYILYKRGPPFQHADFCIMVLDSNCSKPYTWYSTIARVCGTANKTLVLCYVERLETEEQILEWLQRGQLTKVFNSFKVGEVIYRRWVAGRNRD